MCVIITILKWVVSTKRVIMWIKLKVLWLLWGLCSALASSEPQLQRQLLARHFRSRLSPDAPNMAFASKSYIWPWLMNIFKVISFPANTYVFIVNNRNTRKRCEIRSNLTIKRPDWRHDGALMFLLLTLNIFYTLFLVFLLLTLNK